MYKITFEFLCKSLHCGAYKVRMKNGSMVFLCSSYQNVEAQFEGIILLSMAALYM